mmetsp:Transcript_4555/g.11886  ORF Transcript_4555/g.11886 Transcript_4555/m.11886 type:complete len:265 (-) Transcript_4555:327-1121(-)
MLENPLVPYLVRLRNLACHPVVPHVCQPRHQHLRCESLVLVVSQGKANAVRGRRVTHIVENAQGNAHRTEAVLRDFRAEYVSVSRCPHKPLLLADVKGVPRGLYTLCDSLGQIHPHRPQVLIRLCRLAVEVLPGIVKQSRRRCRPRPVNVHHAIRDAVEELHAALRHDPHAVALRQKHDCVVVRKRDAVAIGPNHNEFVVKPHHHAVVSTPHELVRPVLFVPFVLVLVALALLPRFELGQKLAEVCAHHHQRRCRIATLLRAPG